MCRGVTTENRKAGWSEETELNGVEEERDGMSDEEGNEIDGEEELAAPDWRVRAGPRNKPTQREREKHEATHVPFRDWSAQCMMGWGRTHHHVAKQKSEGQSRRPIIAMDYFFMRMESAPNVQAISEESTTCVAVKEDRHQNIMSSVALKKGVEEPLAIERVVRFIDLLSYREITLRIDRACNCRVQESCSCNVQSGSRHRGRNEGRQRIEWAHRECDNSVARNHSNSQVPHREHDAGTTQ